MIWENPKLDELQTGDDDRPLKSWFWLWTMCQCRRLWSIQKFRFSREPDHSDWLDTETLIWYGKEWGKLVCLSAVNMEAKSVPLRGWKMVWIVPSLVLDVATWCSIYEIRVCFFVLICFVFHFPTSTGSVAAAIVNEVLKMELLFSTGGKAFPLPAPHRLQESLGWVKGRTWPWPQAAEPYEQSWGVWQTNISAAASHPGWDWRTNCEV